MARMKILRSAPLGYPPSVHAIEYAPPWAQAKGPPDPQADRDAGKALARHETNELEHPGGATAAGTHRAYRGNELICRFRPVPDAIRIVSQIRHSKGITSARSQPLAGADSPAEICRT
ncbi:hypothetical protein AHAS_Ahas17G0190200 [Arachis hypogaea]